MSAARSDVEVQRGAAIDRPAWDGFVARSDTRTPFTRSWWLDAALGHDGWRVHLVRGRHDRIVAGWAFAERDTRYGAVLDGGPYLPWLGPQLEHVDGPPRKQRSRAKERLEALAASLPDSGVAHAEASCAPELDYLAPLAWHGFELGARATWRLPATTLADLAATRAALSSNTRRTIDRARRGGVEVSRGRVPILLGLHDATFRRQGASGGAPERDALERVARAAREHGCGEVLVARDGGGAAHAAALVAWDDRWTWYVAGGSDPELRKAGGPALVQWRAIEDAAERGTGYDFEGSMLQHVDRFFQGFAPEPAVVPVVKATWSRAWRRRVTLARLLRGS